MSQDQGGMNVRVEVDPFAVALMSALILWYQGEPFVWACLLGLLISASVCVAHFLALALVGVLMGGGGGPSGPRAV